MNIINNTNISKIFEIVLGFLGAENSETGKPMRFFYFIPLHEHLKLKKKIKRWLLKPRPRFRYRKYGKSAGPHCINKVETTADIITDRGGLPLFSRYIEKTGIFGLLEEKFGHTRKSSKGLEVQTLFRQIFCFLFDGTSRHLSYFDDLREDGGYAAAIETDPSEMASSHMMKRFFNKFGLWCGGPFRCVLRKLFIWRLRLEKPEEIDLFIDTMVMDNDEAEKRQGVQPTYKKVKGFQPLQITWNGMAADGIFRGGKKNGNCGDTVVSMVSGLVHLIREEYRHDVTIILRFDSGFFDENNFIAFDAMNIVFIGGGKIYEGVRKVVGTSESDDSFRDRYDNGHQEWDFLEFGFRCSKWKRFYRAVYTRPSDKETPTDFERPDNVILTNIGINEKALEHCSPGRRKYWSDIRTIIKSYHRCGKDELTHRGFKDFCSEQMPFRNFGPNTAMYYCMLISFSLFETFKKDVLSDVIPVTSYATAVRRQAVYIAAKIVRTGRQIILRVSQTVMETLSFRQLWERCQNPPPIPG